MEIFTEKKYQKNAFNNKSFVEIKMKREKMGIKTHKHIILSFTKKHRVACTLIAEDNLFVRDDTF